MRTLAQEIEFREMECKTIEDWKAAYNWVSEKALRLNDMQLFLESAIVEKYGEKALETLADMASDKMIEKMYPGKEIVKETEPNPEFSEIEKDIAVRLFEKGNEVLLLSGHTITPAKNIQEIMQFNGPVGVSKKTLENYFTELIFDKE